MQASLRPLIHRFSPKFPWGRLDRGCVSYRRFHSPGMHAVKVVRLLASIMMIMIRCLYSRKRRLPHCDEGAGLREQSMYYNCILDVDLRLTSFYRRLINWSLECCLVNHHTLYTGSAVRIPHWNKPPFSTHLNLAVYWLPCAPTVSWLHPFSPHA